MEDITKPLACMHEPSSKDTPTVPSGTPEELLVSHSLPTSAQLSWAPIPEDRQNDTITGYIVQVEGPDSTREIPVTDGNATSHEVSDLRPSTTYTFSVRAMTEAGTGPAIRTSSSTPQEGEVFILYYSSISIEYIYTHSNCTHARACMQTYTCMHTHTCMYTTCTRGVD